uniref:CSON011670 protein n=1 Tax=Culicoides sonorensis TaxID=179676 RepID=A0A336M943_CULSO
MKFILTLNIILISFYFAEPSPYILGGNEVSDGEIPYQAFLNIESSQNKTKTCTGTLIKPDLILTSALCGFDFNLGYAILGVSNIEDVSSSLNADVVVIKNVTIHENFNGTTLKNNVALVYLNRSARLKDGFIETVTLPQNINENTLIGFDVSVSGWGPKPSYLKRAQVTVISNLSCKIRFENVLETEICAGSSTTAGPCTSADNGAPIVTVDRETGEEIQIGIFSYSMGCAYGNPVVYTRISSYLAWIEEN